MHQTEPYYECVRTLRGTSLVTEHLPILPLTVASLYFLYGAFQEQGRAREGGQQDTSPQSGHNFQSQSSVIGEAPLLTPS